MSNKPSTSKPAAVQMPNKVDLDDMFDAMRASIPSSLGVNMGKMLSGIFDVPAPDAPSSYVLADESMGWYGESKHYFLTDLENIQHSLREGFFNEMPESIRNGVAIAGGFIRDNLTGMNPKDIDVYTECSTTEEVLITWMKSVGFKEGEHTKDVYNFSTNQYPRYHNFRCSKMQIIRKRHINPKDDSLIRRFDFTVCGAMITNEKIFILPTFLSDLYSRRLKVNHITDADMTFSRSVNFIRSKGYTIDAENMKLILEAVEAQKDPSDKEETESYDAGKLDGQEPLKISALNKSLISKLDPKELVHGIMTTCFKKYDSKQNPTYFCNYTNFLLTVREFPNFTAETLIVMDGMGWTTLSKDNAMTNRWIENTQAYKDYMEFKTSKYLYRE